MLSPRRLGAAVAVLAVVSLTGLAGCSEEKSERETLMASGPEFDGLWNYGAPADTRAKFEALLAKHSASAPDAWGLELRTQIARTHSLASEFSEAHAVLDKVKPLIGEDSPKVLVRYNLERGRAFNSDGKKDEAKPLFIRAWDIASSEGEDTLAVDAAHMVAIAVEGEEALRWNIKALDLARASDDEKARGWIGSLTNNMAWGAFDAGDYEGAIALFEESRDHFLSRDSENLARIARWSIARVKRGQGKLDESLATQLELQAHHEGAGTPDGYVFEELGELYLAMGKEDAARPHFAKAFELISQDKWMVANEADRLARMKSLAKLD